MTDVYNKFSPVEEYLHGGTSVTVQGNDWSDARITHISGYGAEFTIASEAQSGIGNTEANVLGLGALGIETSDISTITDLASTEVHTAIAELTYGFNPYPQRSVRFASTVHRCFMKNFIRLNSSVVISADNYERHEVLAIKAAAGGRSFRHIAHILGREDPQSPYASQNVLDDTMDEFYERHSIPNKVGSVLFGHAKGILDRGAALPYARTSYN